MIQASTVPRIARLAGWLSYAALALILALAAALLWQGAVAWADPQSVVSDWPGLSGSTRPTPFTATASVALGGLALIPALFALLEMRALFQRYRRHEVLTPTCARHIRRAGRWLVVTAGVQLILPTLTVLLLTASNPPGERMLSVSLSSQSLGFVLAGGFLTVIGWAMAEAARAAEENAGFI